jgi:hypothetical protein
MTIKLALLKSGENIIADIKELINEDEKIVSLVFNEPYQVDFLSPRFLTEDNIQETQYSVSFKTWMPLCADKDIAISPDWVVTIVEPVEMVKTSYEEKMNGRRNQSTDGSDGGGHIDTSDCVDESNFID